MKNLVFLITGIVITLLFLVLSYSQNSNIFEMMYFNQGFNDQLYNMSLYPTVAYVITGMAWGGAAVYYYAINSVNFDRWYHWLGVLACVTLVTPIVCYAVISSTLRGAGLDYPSETTHFVMTLFVMTALLFTVASLAMRWWSTNCRHTPFPQ
ncbi:MAG: hypothetical protein HUK11_09215 [Muribaculaceae bacterium]|nr:hypothetical protein [Muribaculaceae bacterium]